MRIITLITGFLFLSCSPDIVYMERRLNGESHEQIAESNKQNFCVSECDYEYQKQWCKDANPIDKVLLCSWQVSEKRCLKECYIPYCKCNEKPEDWNYGMCKGYCEGKKNDKVDDKKNG